MSSDNVFDSLPGAPQLLERYGRAASFHDSEIIALNLRRLGESTLTIQICPPDDPALVHFRMENVTDLDLTGFSSQNVIFSLSVERVVADAPRSTFRIHLTPCYGMAGWIEAETIVVSLE